MQFSLQLDCERVAHGECIAAAATDAFMRPHIPAVHPHAFYSALEYSSIPVTHFPSVRRMTACRSVCRWWPQRALGRRFSSMRLEFSVSLLLLAASSVFRVVGRIFRICSIPSGFGSSLGYSLTIACRLACLRSTRIFRFSIRSIVFFIYSIF